MPPDFYSRLWCTPIYDYSNGWVTTATATTSTTDAWATISWYPYQYDWYRWQRWYVRNNKRRTKLGNEID